MADSTSGLHHSRPSRAVAEPTCWSERSIQQAIITIRNNHTQLAARWVNQQAYTHSYAPSVKYIGVLTLGGVSTLQCRLAVVIATFVNKHPGLQIMWSGSGKLMLSRNFAIFRLRLSKRSVQNIEVRKEILSETRHCRLANYL
jgi:hypothetical protein